MVTVKELVEELSDTRIYAGAEGLFNNINTVSFLDSPSSIDWLKGGEVILTTAFLYKENVDMQIKFVEKLIEMDVVALGIKIGRYIEDIPPEIIAIADKNKFPIFGISFDTVWSEIFTVFHTLELNKKEERSILGTQMITFDKLFRASDWNGDSIRSNFLKCISIDAAIVSDNYEILSYNNNDALPIIHEYCKKAKSKPNPICRITSVFVYKQQTHKILDIVLYQEERLVLCSEKYEVPRAEFDWLVTLYNSIRNKNKFMQDGQMLWKNFVNECLIKGSEENYMDYVKILNLRIISNGVIIIFSDKNAAFMFQHSQDRKVAENLVSIHSSEISDNTVVMLYGYINKTSSGSFFSDLRISIEKVSKKYTDCKIWISGISPSNNLMEYYHQAQIAKEISEIILPERSVVFYHDLSIISILQAEKYDCNDIDYLNEKIQSFDACKTLEIFLECGNINRAAESSFIHSNTMRYRIQKIEQCLNVDLNDPISKINLLVKIKIWRINNKNHQ